VKLANDHLRKFVHEQVAPQNGGEPETGQTPRTGTARAADGAGTFTLKVGLNGTLKLPAALLKRLGLKEGDHLELRVAIVELCQGPLFRKSARLTPERSSGL
jgi:hypothetical protein